MTIQSFYGQYTGVSDSVPILLWERVNSGYQAVLSCPCTNYPRRPGYEARSYACNAQEEPQRLFANSSRECRRIATKLPHPPNTVPHLDLRGLACANKLLPRSVQRRNQPSAILDLCLWLGNGTYKGDPIYMHLISITVYTASISIRVRVRVDFIL